MPTLTPDMDVVTDMDMLMPTYTTLEDSDKDVDSEDFKVLTDMLTLKLDMVELKEMLAFII